VIDKGFIDAMLNVHDQYAWWIRCGRDPRYETVSEEENSAALVTVDKALREVPTRNAAKESGVLMVSS
jgi:hypothetical protein